MRAALSITASSARPTEFAKASTAFFRRQNRPCMPGVVLPWSSDAIISISQQRAKPMKIFLDTANLDELKKGAAWGIVDGVTTNPSLIAKEGRDIAEQIRMICDIVDGDISAEVVQIEANAMIREGRDLAKLHKNVVVKCPLTRDGIKATAAL